MIFKIYRTIKIKIFNRLIIIKIMEIHKKIFCNNSIKNKNLNFKKKYASKLI